MSANSRDEASDLTSTSGRRSEQLNLGISTERPDSQILCRGIFSANYLERRFKQSEGFPTADEVKPLYEVAKARWRDNLPGLRSPRQREAFTCSIILEPLLTDLGWSAIPQADLPKKGPTRKVPDYCLFPSKEIRQQAAAQSETTDIFRFAEAVLEAKRWQHPLDRVSKRDTPGWFPSQQIQDYLRHAKDHTGVRFFNWAILTNGNTWRLYCEQAANDAHFEFTLADGDSFCSLEEFRLFVALFRPEVFARDEGGRCALDSLREESLNCQAALESNLRKRIFDVLEDLATGFRDYSANGIMPADFPALYDNSLICLYRLLFILYAESRGLLPVKPHGYGSNKVYREKFSLAGLVADLRDKSKFNDDAFTELYERLLKLFHLINGDNPKQNQATKVTRYNGGLFNGMLHPRLDQWRVGDRTLANVLRQLVFAQPPARAGAKQQQITTDETIDYASLEVRQLGDIYEGLLGAQLAESASRKRLELRNQNGENHRHGIFYTPDWVVRHLLQETVQPLLDEIEAGSAVQTAHKAKSDQNRRNNSFALAVLGLNLLDPAMGSGHFLVRATEELAKAIFKHDTTSRMTESVVTTGRYQRSREDILKDGRIPVPSGLSQEQAEIAYWRRRVVEACIYGVDVNPLAVELAKLSLWLTCIAADEPLNFLDHHLRHGNSLLSAAPEAMSHRPFVTEEERKQVTDVDIGSRLPTALQAVIAENVNIEQTASTEMELVKAKEKRWKEVRDKFRPFLNCADLWLAALDGLPLNEHDYRLLVLSEVAPKELDNAEKATAKKLRESLSEDLTKKQAALMPFHWRLEFPDVFYEPEGTLRPVNECGFDAVLGNPPYISTHTSSTEGWRDALEKRAGYLEDLYVHFTDLGFQLLRPGGGFGFIVSDTFFTLASKLRMRDMLQRHTLTHLGQCDPFDATVDAAIFVARKSAIAADWCPPQTTSEAEKADSSGAHQSAATPHLLFIQARPRKDDAGKATTPEKDLPLLKLFSDLPGGSQTELADELGTVSHKAFRSLRIHHVPAELYRTAHKRVFFEPRPGTLRLFERFNQPVKDLVAKWWERIETSEKFSENRKAVCAASAKLKPGNVTLVGLIAEGGQGLATANNARFLAYRADSPQALEIMGCREDWTRRWLADPEIKAAFVNLLAQNGGDAAKPTRHAAAWEACVEPLRGQFSSARLGFTKTSLYRVAPKELVAGDSDFRFAWQQRKTALLQWWRTAPDLGGFWQTGLKDSESRKRARALLAGEVSDKDFCVLCQELQTWLVEENAARKRQRLATIPRDTLGLRSGEDYTNPADAPRIATIYYGLSGRGRFLPFRKGDPEGNRWLENEPLYIEWSPGSVRWLFENSGKKAPQMPVMRNPDFFLRAGISWTRGANHVPIKGKMIEPAIMDVNAMKLSPLPESGLPAAFLLAIFNSDVFSFHLKKFVAHTWMAQISDLRMMPLVMPTKAQVQRLEKLATQAMEAKRLTFTGGDVPHALVASVRDLTRELLDSAPAYLHPSAQTILLTTAADCLQILELAVNWEAERLYGVEGLGPFDEF